MNTEEIPINHSGICACGEVGFTFTGDPINSAYCYCKSCQFRTNADRWFGVWVPRENLTFTRGKPSSFIRKGDSGKTVDFLFCGNCGITLAGFAEIGDFSFRHVVSPALDNTCSAEISKDSVDHPGIFDKFLLVRRRYGYHETINVAHCHSSAKGQYQSL